VTYDDSMLAWYNRPHRRDLVKRHVPLTGYHEEITECIHNIKIYRGYLSRPCLCDEEQINEKNNARIEGRLLKTMVICAEIVESNLNASF